MVMEGELENSRGFWEPPPTGRGRFWMRGGRTKKKTKKTAARRPSPVIIGKALRQNPGRRAGGRF